MKRSQAAITRRSFLFSGALTSTLSAICVGGVVSRVRAAAGSSNPFAYEVEQFSKTDPKLIAYEEIAKFRAGIAEPRRLKLDAQGRVLIAGKSGTVIIDAAGSRLSEVKTASPARAVEISPEGEIYVALRDHVEVYGNGGELKSKWTAPDRKPWLTGLALSGNELFVADSGSRSILRYDRSGKFLSRIGEKNKERNVPGLIVPSPYLDVAIGKDGLLRVNNPGRHCVELYTASGDYELNWGKPSAAIQGFCGCCNPIALSLLSDNRCITAEKGLQRVKIYAADGTFESVVAGTESFPENSRVGSVHDLSDGTMGGLDVAVDPQGRIYILDLVAADVHIMKPKGKPA